MVIATESSNRSKPFPCSARVRMLDGCNVLELNAQRSISYQIVNIQGGIFDLSASHVSDFVGDRPTFVVADEGVLALYGEQMLAHFSQRSNLSSCMSTPGTESAKSWRSVERICQHAVNCGLDRSAVMIGVGGGVVMDLVGVAASLYRRGVDYLRIPTTLVGIVDVAVGIKTAFNFEGKKSALGAFHPPLGAIADRQFLRTLRKRDLVCGLAEIIKMGIVRDARLFDLVDEYGSRLIETSFSLSSIADEVILRAQISMMDDLEPNLFELDKRRLVDFGHTISPSLEEATQYELAHGEAVAIDMLLSTAIGVVQGVCEINCYGRMANVYDCVGLPRTSPALDMALVKDGFSEARKHRDGDLNLVVPTRIGDATFIQAVSDTELRRALQMVVST